MPARTTRNAAALFLLLLGACGGSEPGAGAAAGSGAGGEAAAPSEGGLDATVTVDTQALPGDTAGGAR